MNAKYGGTVRPERSVDMPSTCSRARVVCWAAKAALHKTWNPGKQLQPRTCYCNKLVGHGTDRRKSMYWTTLTTHLQAQEYWYIHALPLTRSSQVRRHDAIRSDSREGWIHSSSSTTSGFGRHQMKPEARGTLGKEPAKLITTSRALE